MDIQKMMEAAKRNNSRIVGVKPVDLAPLPEETEENSHFAFKFILLDEDGVERCMTGNEWDAWLAEPTDSPVLEEDEQEPSRDTPPADPRRITAVAPLTKAAPIPDIEVALDENDPCVLRISYTDEDGVERTHRAKDFMEYSA